LCGAEGLVLCANTMHMLADEVETQTGLPVVHIASATASVIAGQGLQKVGLLGTRFTMERDFFTNKLAEKGISAIIPGENDRVFIQRSIAEELGRNIFTTSTRQRYLQMMDQLQAQGAEGIILGCTEIPLLVKPEECPLPAFNTTAIHAEAAVNFSLGL
jgi:aspartate racemase